MGRARQPLGAEDEQPGDHEDEDVLDAEAEHVSPPDRFVGFRVGTGKTRHASLPSLPAGGGPGAATRRSPDGGRPWPDVHDRVWILCSQ
ncbi:hypothetical protein GCM10023192_23520 [Amycolatopsis samaneae]